MTRTADSSNLVLRRHARGHPLHLAVLVQGLLVLVGAPPRLEVEHDLFTVPVKAYGALSS